jgi:phage gpG-like protein
MNNIAQMQQKLQYFFQNQLLRLIGSTALAFYQDSWRRKGYIKSSYKQWKPRNPNAPRHSGRALMVDSGALRRSMTYLIAGNIVEIRSNMPYAQMHNEGLIATITIKSHSRKTKSGGQTTVKSHSRNVQLPQRQFMDFGNDMSPFLIKRIEMIVAKKIDEIVKQFI